MVRVDFTIYTSFSACPVWWRNFVTFALNGLENAGVGEKNFALDRVIEKHHGSIVDNENPEDVDALEFETEEDLNAFKIYWTLYGQ